VYVSPTHISYPEERSCLEESEVHDELAVRGDSMVDEQFLCSFVILTLGNIFCVVT
jgi:hypothetical protein